MIVFPRLSLYNRSEAKKVYIEKAKYMEDRTKVIEHSIITTYRKTLWRQFIKGIQDYELIQEGDKIAVCISGGKDSMLLAKLMQEVQRHGKFPFELIFICMDPGYNPANRALIEENAKTLGIPLQIFESNIFNVVHDIEKSPCYLCARMRRGFLYDRAQSLGCNKIALGHHFDDVIETIMMGMMYGSQIQTMMPKLHSTNFKGMELIRPMYLIKEKDVIQWAKGNNLRFLNCACRFTEEAEAKGVVEHTSKREEMKNLIKELKKINPRIDQNIFKSVENINLKTVISYVDHEGKEHSFLDDYDEME